MITKHVLELLLYALGIALAICSVGGVAGNLALKFGAMAEGVGPMMGKLYNYLFDLGAWVPGMALREALIAAVPLLFAALCMKIGRMILSLFTGGGGSAA